jgi:hypothetical protein
MPTLKDNKVELEQSQFSLLVILSVRNALGRSTYMTSEVVNFVLASRDCLTTYQLEQVQREVSKELEIAHAENKFVGMEMDHKNWLKLVNEIHKTVQERNGVRQSATK